MLKAGDVILTNIQFTDTFEIKKDLLWFFLKSLEMLWLQE